ncbi:CoA transferase [uncultured Corynebacterium sp.]|uniref:CoA transferase n=1 Tax=uncultured Corynebacterium sp. TaxID=159447 RepID=UPI0025F4DFF5|nr:CoA transferase [uncultured Corynebacterium sp.]
MNQLPNFTVVTLAPNLPGPVAAKRLHELGGTVIKVEGPGKAADPMRVYCEPYYQYLVEGQEVRSIDLKQESGLRELHELLAEADLLLTSSRPASLQRLGLGWEDLHARYPSLAQVAIVGHSGEHVDVAGHDLTYEAHAGTLSFNGDEPVMPVVPIADLAGAERAVSQALAALWQASATGQGSYHEVALADMATEFATPARFRLTGPDTLLGGLLPGYGLYQTECGGWVAIAALEPHFFVGLIEALHAEGLLPEGTTAEQMQSKGITAEQLAAAVGQKTAAWWDEVASKRNLPIAAVRGGA